MWVARTCRVVHAAEELRLLLPAREQPTRPSHAAQAQALARVVVARGGVVLVGRVRVGRVVRVRLLVGVARRARGLDGETHHGRLGGRRHRAELHRRRRRGVAVSARGRGDVLSSGGKGCLHVWRHGRRRGAEARRGAGRWQHRRGAQRRRRSCSGHDADRVRGLGPGGCTCRHRGHVEAQAGTLAALPTLSRGPAASALSLLVAPLSPPPLARRLRPVSVGVSRSSVSAKTESMCMSALEGLRGQREGSSKQN